MNFISVSGNVARDMEIRFLPNGDAVGNFSVADNQGKDKTAIFWNATIYGKRAQSLEAYILKGQPVTIVGAVSEREWTDKSGNQRKSMGIRVNEIALQGGKPQGDSQPRQAAKPAKQNHGADLNDDLSDIPF